MASVITETRLILRPGARLYLQLGFLGEAEIEVVDVDGEVATVHVSGPVAVHQEHHLTTLLGPTKRRSTWWHGPVPARQTAWMVFGLRGNGES